MEASAGSLTHPARASGRFPRVPVERKPPSRRVLALVIGPLIALVIAANVGDALAPTLVDRNPLLLIALNARNRNLLLTVNLIEPIPYYVVGTVRLLASDPLFYLLGFWYGDRALSWAEKRAPRTGGFLRKYEAAFRRATYPFVFIAPNNIVCLFAGSIGMRPPVFLTLNVTGTIVRLAMIAWLGDIFAEPIDDVLGFIAEYRWYLTGFTVAIVILSSARQAAKGGGEVAELRELEHELEHPEERALESSAAMPEPATVEAASAERASVEPAPGETATPARGEPTEGVARATRVDAAAHPVPVRPDEPSAPARAAGRRAGMAALATVVAWILAYVVGIRSGRV